MLRHLAQLCLVVLLLPPSTSPGAAGPPTSSLTAGCIANDRANLLPDPEPPPARVGQLFVVGNERTRTAVILDQVPLYPGQVLELPDLARAEKNLAKLGIFQDGEGVRPSVTVLENPSDSGNPYRDVLVQVAECDTSGLLFGLGVNSGSGVNVSAAFEERNFDLFSPPTDWGHLKDGRAFRGAGQKLRIALNFSLSGGLNVSVSLVCPSPAGGTFTVGLNPCCPPLTIDLLVFPNLNLGPGSLCRQP